MRRAATVGWTAITGLLAWILLGGVAAATPFIVENNGSLSEGRIITFEFINSNAKNTPRAKVVDSFVPEGFKPGVVDKNKGILTATVGRGVALVGGFLFYTEVPGSVNMFTGAVTFEPTAAIEVVPFNAGKGAAKDVLSIPNPRKGSGIQDLATDSKGNLWVLTGYIDKPLEVFEYSVTLPPANDGKPTVNLAAGPIKITDLKGKPVGGGSDGFTVLPNGNFLINTGDAVPGPNGGRYNEYDGKTGKQEKGKGVTVPAGKPTVSNVKTDSGVDVGPVIVDKKVTDGLFFVSDENIGASSFLSFTETTLDGKFIAKSLLPYGAGQMFPNGLPMEDIAVIDSLTGGIVPTPEPPTLLVVGLGLSMFGIAGRRHLRAK